MPYIEIYSKIHSGPVPVKKLVQALKETSKPLTSTNVALLAGVPQERPAVNKRASGEGFGETGAIRLLQHAPPRRA